MPACHSRIPEPVVNDAQKVMGFWNVCSNLEKFYQLVFGFREIPLPEGLMSIVVLLVK
jgi:hypothetical protein